MDYDSKFKISWLDALKGASALGILALASKSLSLPFATNVMAQEKPVESDEKIIWSTCTVNCGSRCSLKMYVVGDEIKWGEFICPFSIS